MAQQSWVNLLNAGSPWQTAQGTSLTTAATATVSPQAPTTQDFVLPGQPNGLQWYVGMQLRLRARGNMSSGGTTTSLTVFPAIGVSGTLGTALCTTPAIVLGATTLTTLVWTLESDITCTALGSTGNTLISDGMLTMSDTAANAGTLITANTVAVGLPFLASEMLAVQAVSGTTWTVMRGAEGSAPVAHASGFTVVQVVTAGDLAGLQYRPWEFPVSAYGAEGDGKIGTGGTGASGQAVLTDAGASFVNAAAPAGDVGKYIIVNQGTGSATVATNPFAGTIISVNSATSITLSANLAATCTAAPYVYGTDDAAAVNAAVLAAAQWAVTTGNYKVQVIFQPALYMLGALVQSATYGFSPFNTGLNYTYNTHIPVPFALAAARKLIIDLIGVGDASEPDFWGSAVPGVQGTCLVSGVFPPSQPDATFGQMSVIGTPATQANIGTGGVAHRRGGDEPVHTTRTARGAPA